MEAGTCVGAHAVERAHRAWQGRWLGRRPASVRSALASIGGNASNARHRTARTCAPSHPMILLTRHAAHPVARARAQLPSARGRAGAGGRRRRVVCPPEPMETHAGPAMLGSPLSLSHGSWLSGSAATSAPAVACLLAHVRTPCCVLHHQERTRTVRCNSAR
jgi:hypothetical protein